MSNSIPIPGGRQAQAIQEARPLLRRAFEHGQVLKDALHDLEARLHVVCATDDNAELLRLLERVERVQQIFNSMELGSLMIKAGNTLDEAWRRLP